MADVADLRLDLTEPGFYLRPDYFEVLADLRRQAPVRRTLDGSWAVSRYDDIRTISRDPGRFVSGRGVLINDPLRSDGSGGLPPSRSSTSTRRSTPCTARSSTVSSPRRRLRRLEGMIRRTVAEALDAVPADEPVDAVERLASVVPIAVIAELFGVGDADREVFRRWSDAIIASPDQADVAGSAPEVGQMAEFLMAHVDSAATEGNDLLEILKGAELDGRPLNGIEIMGFCLTLLVAGNETTRTLISGGMEALHQRPDQRADLAADPSRLATAVEELLRWVTPIQAFGRTAVVDVELGGQEVPAGDFLVMLYASGNRDEAAFGPTAGQLDVRRPVIPTHVAFGFGEHLCLGASLARLEARLFFEGLLSRYPSYELVGEPEYVRSTVVRGASRLPVVLAP